MDNASICPCGPLALQRRHLSGQARLLELICFLEETLHLNHDHQHISETHITHHGIYDQLND